LVTIQKNKSLKNINGLSAKKMWLAAIRLVEEKLVFFIAKRPPQIAKFCVGDGGP
jgi:tyrosine-protein phosphatase YwqE